MWANEPEMAQKWEDEELEENEDTSSTRMTKKDLVEYINSKKMMNEQRDQYDFPNLNEVTGQERRDIIRYFEILRQSGIINMFGSHGR